ncbi:Lsr2-like DNA bridging protein [Mycobacterium phage Lucyedi]|nr:Lsr2-like DNA bridging protein [Mycobacterium phage Lucyedi]
MARQLIMKMTDDIDRTKQAVSTRVIGWEGFDYILDLSAANDKKLLELLQPWLDAAHEKVKQRKPSSRSSSDKKTYPPIALGKEEREAIREWARDKGYEVGDKGVIARRVIEAYMEAHSV